MSGGGGGRGAFAHVVLESLPRAYFFLYHAAGLRTGRRPAPRNHATARASASSAGAGLKPSSRSALACVTHIFFFAMRTASSGTRGGWPEMPAHALLHAPAQYATR